MEKEFIPYELALELKELGFDEECLAYWHDNSNKLVINQILNYTLNKNKLGFGAPLWQQAFDWFAQVHNLYSWQHSTDNIIYWFTISQNGKYARTHLELNSYKDAKHACLKQLIEIIKNDGSFNYI